LKTVSQFSAPSVVSWTLLPAVIRWLGSAGSIVNGLTNWYVSSGGATDDHVCPPSVVLEMSLYV
jgi:hypothetical protein